MIATPAGAAQDAADRLVGAGVTAILNFAPQILSVPRGVTVRKVDLAVELQILSFYQRRRALGPVERGRRRPGAGTPGQRVTGIREPVPSA